MANLEVVSSGSFGDFFQNDFCDGEVGDGNGGMNTICSRPEVIGDDAISGEDAGTCRGYVCINLCVAK